MALILLLSACASVPYQQMSDARQAIEAARPVVAGQAGPEDMLKTSREHLRAAEAHLEEGRYERARERADEAKRLAIEAREAAD